MAAEYTGKTTEKPLSYIYTGRLPECTKPEARLYLEKINAQLRKKLEAERIHGSAENTAYLEIITIETEAAINGMQSDS